MCRLRCDRQSPCGACERRGTPSECVFSCSEQERKDAIDYRPHARSKRTRRRIERLEGLVTEMKDMMQNLPRPSENSPSQSGAFQDPLTVSDNQGTDSLGRLSITDSHAQYIGNAHWATILEDVRRFKSSDAGCGNQFCRSKTSKTSSRMTIPRQPLSKRAKTSKRVKTAKRAKNRSQLTRPCPGSKQVESHCSPAKLAYPKMRFWL